MFRDFFSQDNVKKWLLAQAKNTAYTVLILIVVSLWSVRTGLLELSQQVSESYRLVQSVVDIQANLLNRLTSIKKPANTLNWIQINTLNTNLKKVQSPEDYATLFEELQRTILNLSSTFEATSGDSGFLKLVSLLENSQRHLSLYSQHHTQLSTLYATQRQRFPHRYFDAFYDLPSYPTLSLPNNFEHIDVISTLKEDSDDA